MYTDEKIVYVKIPQRNKEIKYNQNIKQNNYTLKFETSIPKKNLNNKQIGILIQSNNYISVKTEDIFTDFLVLGNQIEKAIKTIGEVDFVGPYHSINTYIETFLKNHISDIKNFSFEDIIKYKDKNNEIRKKIEIKTIDCKMKELMKKYEYYQPNEFDFYVFIFEVWEIIHLKKNLYDGFFQKPYLYSIYQRNDLKKDFSNKLNYFLKKYESFSSFKFHLEARQDSYNPFNMFLATEELRVPIMFECLSELSAIDMQSKYTICSVPGCYRLFRKTQNNNTRCNLPDCESNRVKSYNKN